MGVSEPLEALYRGDEQRGDALLAAKGEPDAFEAAAFGRTERLRALLAESPELVDERSPDGFTLLHLAAFFGRAEAAEVLVERGADVNVLADHEEIRVRPLQSAAAGGHREIARLLLEHGADPNAPQPGGGLPLHAAAQNGDRELAELLLERGADRSAATDDGRKPVDFARERGHEELATLLTE